MKSLLLHGLLAGFLTAGALTYSTNASALGPVDLEVAAKAGLGTNPLNSGPNSGPNPLGFGIGGRAGVSLFSTFYAGLSAMYYVGESQSLSPPVPGPSFTISDHAIQYGVEGGYNIYLLQLIGLSPVEKLITLRPQVGLGNLTITVESKGGGLPNSSTDSSSLYLEPGLTGLVTVGPLLAGLDVNALWLPNLSKSNVAITAHAQLGLKF